MREGSVLILLGAALGCDFWYGFSRYGPLSQFPQPDCVEAVVRHAPGVQDVEATHSKGGRPLTLTGIKPASDVYSYYYRGADFEGQVLIEHAYDGSTSFYQMYGRVNAPVPQERVDAVRPVMAYIERELASKCSFQPAQGQLDQSCSHVNCPELSSPPQ